MNYHRNHALSCGVLMITDLQEPYGNQMHIRNKFLNAYMRACRDPLVHPRTRILMFSTVIFSDNTHGNANMIAPLLANLGTVTKSPFIHNPISFNEIAVWVWQPSTETVAKLRTRVRNNTPYVV